MRGAGLRAGLSLKTPLDFPARSGNLWRMERRLRTDKRSFAVEPGQEVLANPKLDGRRTARSFSFRVLNSDPTGARTGLLMTRHGTVSTPAFMPVGTQGTVKGVLPSQVAATGAEMILGNTYHLALRPGADLVARAGGLHRFMGWEGPILTDSGGFQVFSLARNARVSDGGVTFASHIDGAPFELTPARALAIQQDLGSDVMMVLDVCSPFPCEEGQAERDMHRTLDWAEQSLREVEHRYTSAIFCIAQGSVYPQLRRECAGELARMDFDGYAVGGLSVGEGRELMREALEAATPLLPWDKPRYAMGVGDPSGIFDAVERGIDMFDCVMPTRSGRTARLYTRAGTLNMNNACHREDFSPIDPECVCTACRDFTRAYVHHLFRAGEMLACQLATIHNLTFWQDMMRGIRTAIGDGRLGEFRAEFMARFSKNPEGGVSGEADDF